METTKQNVLVVAVLGVLLGVGIGYGVGTDRSWYASSTEKCAQGALTAGHGMNSAMGDMMSGLEGKTGEALERAFLNEMIVHHEGAVEMARELLAGTKRPELVKMGNDIITVQTQEIEMMKTWRAEWFGN